MLDDLRKELRQDMHLCINNATSPLYAEIQQQQQAFALLYLHQFLTYFKAAILLI
jgi:hypothetical protein